MHRKILIGSIGNQCRFHGCCWETFYIFAYCGVVGNPHLTAKILIFAPLSTSTKLRRTCFKRWLARNALASEGRCQRKNGAPPAHLLWVSEPSCFFPLSHNKNSRLGGGERGGQLAMNSGRVSVFTWFWVDCLNTRFSLILAWGCNTLVRESEIIVLMSVCSGRRIRH